MKERYERRVAFIVKTRDQGEADRLLYLVTPDEGKIIVAAKGARRPTSRLGGTLQPLCLVDMSFYRGKRLTVTGAVALRSWRRVKESYEAMTAALFVGELLLLSAPEGQEAQAPLDLAVEALDRMEAGKEPLSSALMFARDLLQAMGWGIDFSACAECHRPIEGPATLRPLRGEVSHASCRQEGLRLAEVTVEGLIGGEIPGEAVGHVMDALLAIWQGHLEGEIRTAASVRQAFFRPGAM